MKKIYYLGNCSTCQRIIAELHNVDSFEQQEIKSEPMTAAQVDEMQAMAGSYEALFSRRAMKFRGMGLHNQDLTEADYRRLIIEEYTFLKRPVIIIQQTIFVGNSKKVVEAAIVATGA